MKRIITLAIILFVSQTNASKLNIQSAPKAKIEKKSGAKDVEF